MSALAGVVLLDGAPVNPAGLTAMIESLAHRGPDGSGMWTDANIGIAHRMLHVTPESLCDIQPRLDKAKDLVVAADVRLDNREELCDLFGIDSSLRSTLPDSALVLSAYRRWGEDFPAHLLGAFAILLWDARRQSLLLARDPFGIKTIYYHYQSGRRFVCASEIKALFSYPGVPKRLNEVRIADYLSSLVEDKTLTFYDQIEQVPAAHVLTVRPEGMRLREYWALDPEREIRYERDEDYAEAFRDVFTEAVRCRLRSAFPIGSSLSGGLDSSSVTCMASRLLRSQGRGLHTFSAVFDELPECDEREYIRTVLHQEPNLTPHFIALDQKRALGEIEDLLEWNDQPLFVRNAFLWTNKYARAQELGIRVMLDGEDGDTIVSHGEAYLGELARAGEWEAFAQSADGLMRHFADYDPRLKSLLDRYVTPYLAELRRRRAWGEMAQALYGIHRHLDQAVWPLLRTHVVKPLAPEPLKQLSRIVRGRDPNPPPPGSVKDRLNQKLLLASFAENVGLEARKAEMHGRYAPTTTLREAQWQGLTMSSAWPYEEVGKIAAAHHMEGRHPFHDRRVVEFCLALPPEQKLKGEWPRWILRRGMEGILPPAVQWRIGKSSLGANFQRSLIEFEKDRLDDLLIHDPSAIAPYVSIPFIQKAYTHKVANYVWPAAVLGIWLRRHTAEKAQPASTVSSPG